MRKMLVFFVLIGFIAIFFVSCFLYTFSLTTNAQGNGQVILTPQKDEYAKDEAVSALASPSVGWEFVNWSGDLTGSVNPSDIQMDKNKEITAVFSLIQYNVNVEVVGGGYVSESPDKITFTHGESVILSASPDEGWLFDHWEGDISGTENPLSVQVNSNLNITAVFIQKTFTVNLNIIGEGVINCSPSKVTYTYGEEIMFSADASKGWVFYEWGGDLRGSNPNIINIYNNLNITAIFVDDMYLLNTSVEGSGEIVRTPSKRLYTRDEVVMVEAVPSIGWEFLSWDYDLAEDDNPTDILMNESKYIKAVFELLEYDLDIKISGGGMGNVIKNPDKVKYMYGEEVTLTAVPDIGWHFVSWSGDVPQYTDNYEALMDGINFNFNNPLTITILGTLTIDANFAINTYELTLNSTGNGAVGKNPEKNKYDHGDVVTICATPNVGWHFSGWYENGELFTTENSTSLTIEATRTLDALFEINKYELALDVTGNGTATKDPTKTIFEHGDECTLTAIPDIGWHFVNWSGDVPEDTNNKEALRDGISFNTNNPLIITIEGSKTIDANFEINTYELTLNSTGNGEVGKHPNKDKYNHGDLVTVYATPDIGWHFSGWYENGELFTTDNSTDLTIEATRTLSVLFKINTYSLTLEASGNGIFAKNPDKDKYNHGTEVTIVATPDYGWHLTEWLTKNSSTSANPLKITMDATKNYRAIFDRNEYTLDLFTTADGTASRNPDKEKYLYEDEVTLTATPYNGYRFVKWEISDNSTSSNNPYDLTMNEDKTATAVFIEECTLTIDIIRGGNVSPAPGTYTYTVGEEVTLTAIENYTAFRAWIINGNYELLDGPENNKIITIKLNGNVEATALFNSD